MVHPRPIMPRHSPLMVRVEVALAWSIRPSVSYPLPLHPIAMEHNPGATVRGLYGEYSFLSRILSLPSGIVCQFIVYTYLRFQTHAYSPELEISDSCLLSRTYVSPQHIVWFLHTIVETEWVVINSLVLVIRGTFERLYHKFRRPHNLFFWLCCHFSL